MSSAVAEATSFLAPVYDREQFSSVRSASLVQRLSTSLTSSADDNETRRVVVRHALDLLARIRTELPQHVTDASSYENPADRQTILSLLDLLVLEGIYPSLSSGMGIPIERRSRGFGLLAKMVPAKVREVAEDKELLEEIVDALLSTMGIDDAEVGKVDVGEVSQALEGHGVARMVRDRFLADMLAGCGELAFNPDITASVADKHQRLFDILVEVVDTGTLLRTLMSLLPTAPRYFKVELLRILSLVPISREHGVRSIVELFLSTGSGISDASAVPQLSVEAMTKASRVIVSVPSVMSAAEYISKMGPQVLELLQSHDPGLQKAAAFVIADVLGKKGDAGEIVQRELVSKIISNFNPKSGIIMSPPSAPNPKPSDEKKTSSALLAFEDTSPAPRKATFSLVTEMPDESSTPGTVDDSTLVSEESLSTALRNLETLLSSHPSPLIPERFIKPILTPLWCLLCFAKATNKSTWYTQVSAILKVYVAQSLDASFFSTLLANLTRTGGDGWAFAPGPSGGIEIRQNPPGGSKGVDVRLIDARVVELMDIIEDDTIKDAVLNQFFLSVLRAWLSRAEDQDPLHMLIVVKVLQAIIGMHADTLAKRPTETLQIVKSVLDEHVTWCQSSENASATTSESPRLATLSNIASQAPEEDADERTETTGMALSLLAAIISSPDTKLTESDGRLLITISPTLSYLSTAPIVSEELRTLASNIAPLLSLHSPEKSTTQTPLVEQQKETYATALSYLRDPLIPVRAHGLHLLRELILVRAAPVDVAATTKLLVGMLKDGDSFIYLNVVKCLSALTDKHPKSVVRRLLEAYADESATLDLDQRLRLGEALLSTVQRLGEALVGELAHEIGGCMLSLISRRRTRVSTGEDSTAPPAKGKQPEDAEGSDSDSDMDEEGLLMTDEQKAARNIHARIVASWSGAATKTEDLRLRTSALSILGAAVETNASGLGKTILRDAVDVSLSVLSLETAEGAAIVRRAAVLCIGSVLKAAVGTGGTEGRLNRTAYAVAVERAKDARRVLGYVRATDSDGLVREQAGVVEENLEAVLERAVGAGAREERVLQLGSTIRVV